MTHLPDTSYLHRQRIALQKRLECASCCDLCGKWSHDLEMHEIITRGRTMNNEDARMASYDAHITALLCQPCHSRAHNQETAEKLLLVNIERYGREAVQAAWDTCVGFMRSAPSITFPEETDNG